VGTVYRKTGGTTARPVLKPIATGLPRPPGPIARPMGPPMPRPISPMLPGALAAFPLARRQRIARMIRRHKWMHARGFAGSLDATSGRYVPDSSEILISSPRPGTFYIPRSGIYPIKVAEVAYGPANKKAGLLAMNASTWNDHVRRGTKGWEAYKVSGLQFDPKYGTNPRSIYGSGTSFPVIWIPPLDGKEPEAVIVSPAPIAPPLPPAPGSAELSVTCPVCGRTWKTHGVPVVPPHLPCPFTGFPSAAPPTPIPVPPTPPPAGGIISGRYVPSASQILTAAPRPGTFYRPRLGIYPIKVAEVAYGEAGRKAGVLSMNASSWNDHVRRGTKGWEAYKVSGLQFDPKYGSHPCSTYNTGKLYPVIWIPPLTGEEPEVWFSKPSPVPPTPPPYVPPVPPYVPPVPPYVPPTPPYVPPKPTPGPEVPEPPPFKPYVPPPDVPPVPPDVPPVPPWTPPIAPPVPPYVPPPYVPPGAPGSGGLGSVLAGVTILGAVARLFER